jgi:2-oxoisovalerate dehydrogenase E1 component
MYWRTNGAWQSPVILMISCGGYKPGLGPFHAQTLESVMAHTPGVDVVMPSSASDAAGLLNAAFASGRPTIFLYPKSALNLSDRRTSADTDKQFVLPGRARSLTSGKRPHARHLRQPGHPEPPCRADARGRRGLCRGH